MFSVFVQKMRTIPALGTGVVRISLLTLKALLDAGGGGALAFLNSRNAFVVLIPKVHSSTKHLLLGFLIFKADYHFIHFGLFFSVEESGQAEYPNTVPLLQLSPESVII